MNLLIKLFAPLILVSLLTGCASKQRFGYTISPAPAGTAPSRTVEVLAVSDVRTNKEIDQHFTGVLLEDVRTAVASELESTGLFKAVNAPALTQAPSPLTTLPSEGRGESKGEKNGVAEWRLRPALKRLEWEVPGYSSMVGKAFLLSLATGGIGGGIYVSTSTTVNGFTVVHLELTEAQGGRVVLAREYPAFYTEKMAKGSCDTSPTRTRIVTEAFKLAMGKFKADVAQLKLTTAPRAP